MAGAVEQEELAAGQLGQPLADRVRADAVVGAVDDEHRAADPGAEGLHRRATAPSQPSRPAVVATSVSG